MSREIKYRAWDKTLSKMLDVVSLDWRTNSGCTKQKPSHLFCELNKVSFDGIHDSEIIDDISERFELMQFIGRSVKDNKNIYDGDILGEKGDPNCFLIVWDTERFGFGYVLQNNGSQEISPITPEFLEEQSVIGNKFENPELLNQ